MTDKDTVSVTFNCPKCGGKKISLPDDHTDDSLATCANPECGVSFGRFGDIKARAREMVAEDVREKLRNVFKGRKGWKLTSRS